MATRRSAVPAIAPPEIADRRRQEPGLAGVQRTRREGQVVEGGSNSTLTRNMFNALRDQIDPAIAAVLTLMIVVTTL